MACALPALAQSDETAKRFHVLPHLADGGGWKSSLLVTNVSLSASPCTLQLYGSLDVDRFEAASGVTVAGSTATFELPASGGNLAWPTRNDLAEASGYATLDCVNPVVAQVVFARIGSAGTPTGMATVFSSQTATVFQFPVLTPAGTLALAIANDANSEASCRVRLADPQGTRAGEEAMLSVPMKSNHTQFLNQAIQIPEDFTGGAATVSCDQQVAMIGLHFELRSDGSIITFNTLPPAVVDPSLRSSDETAKRFHVLPHIASGGGWKSSLLITNVSPSASPCTLQLYGDLDVDRFEAAGGVAAAGSTATFELPASGGNLAWPTRNDLAEASGYATLDCVNPVVAQVVFARIGSAGTPTGMATVFSSQTATVFQFPVLTPAGTLGLAIANDTNSEASCLVRLADPQGMRLGESTLSAPAKSNVAQMLNAAVAIPEAFRGGTARLACDQPVSVIGLHLELEPDGGIVTFNTLPPAVIDVVRPTARLSASPSAIEFGEETTLTWSSTNAVSAVITPDIGDMAPSGSRKVSPNSTTTFRLTVTSADGLRETASATVTVTAPRPGSVASDRAVLEAIYGATHGEFWTDSTNWKTAAPLGEWHGVETNEAGRVRSLDLSRNRLTGPIPTELAYLVQLEGLFLQENNLEGPIPAELGYLANLEELKLGGNELSGLIPTKLGDLANLRILSLDRNGYLSGPIPAELGNLVNLWDLELEGNKLSGPIPARLGRLTRLTRLGLHGNDLRGPIPAELGNLVNLKYLTLRGNDLRGPIPAELGNLANLIELDLSFLWGLSGPLPSGLLERSSLKELDIFVTQVCAPAAWQEWLATIEFFGALCEAGDEVATVDVAVVYTPAARELAGGKAGIEAAIDLMVAETNEAYAASGVRHRMALVERSEVRYSETGDGGYDLERLVDPEDGYMDEAHTLRDRVGADLVHLIVSRAPGLCGIAILPGAFALTVLDCGGITMAHETGHNMGLHHDRFDDQLKGRDVPSHPAYGYVNQRALDAGSPPSSHWRTIMATRTDCRLADVNCSLLLRFSNPRQRHNGDPLGVAYGTGEKGGAGAADAAAVLNAMVPAVAAWRERPSEGDNQPPVAVRTLPDRRLPSASGVLEVNVSRAFADPDGDPLVYSASSSAPTVVAVTSAGLRVTLTAVREGTATIRVTATDPGGLSVSTSFSVTATGPADTDPQSSVASDRAALETIYSATGGEAWTDSTNWKTAAPLGEWHGVETNQAGRVSSLDLSRNRLTGPIPIELAYLAQLEELFLSVNNLEGPIPPELGSLTQLRELHLTVNDLSGAIPAELGSLANLAVLKLGDNELSGPIPAELGNLANLRRFSLGGNGYLSGPIPAELGNLVNLTDLELDRNKLSGPIPARLGRLTRLTRLGLHGNDLSGAFPAELGNLVNLKYLTVRGNDLRGPIPARLGNLVNLIELDLSFLWGLSGPLPSGLIERSSLEELDIFATQLCAPAAWQEWLATIEFFGALCEAGDEVATVDVAVVYTPAARELAGGKAGIEAAIDLMVAETNEAYAASGVRHRMALVERSEVRYSETGDGGYDLERLVDPEDGYMDEAHTLRDRVGADLVHLIVSRAPGLCGIAILPGAFALTVLDCGGITMAHETGHNMGLHHDRFDDQLKGRDVPSHPAYGYVNQRALDAGSPPSSHWRTIMATRTDCRLADVNCSLLLRFSNPRQRHNGDPLGVAYGTGEKGVAGAADAATVLNVMMPTVAAWRDPPSGANQRPVAVRTLPDRRRP